MFPAARLTDTTATLDPIVGPGVPTVLICELVASVVTDSVVGPACSKGTITLGSLTVLIGKLPAARITSVVGGINPESGAPIVTAVATGAPTVLIGG